MMYFGNKPYKVKSSNFEELLKESERYNTIPKDSSGVINSLRLLRNQDSHGYDIPEFLEMYELFVHNENIFIDICSYCDKLCETEDNTKKTRRMNLGD